MIDLLFDWMGHHLIFTVIGAYVLTVLTWVFYLAVVVLARHRDRLSGAAKFFGYQALAVGYVLDILLNIFIMTFVFLDPPHELLFTDRLKRYIREHEKEDYRQRLAQWFCTELLDQFDPSGDHC